MDRQGHHRDVEQKSAAAQDHGLSEDRRGQCQVGDSTNADNPK
jgi:hypothetical protein